MASFYHRDVVREHIYLEFCLGFTMLVSLTLVNYFQLKIAGIAAI